MESDSQSEFIRELREHFADDPSMTIGNVGGWTLIGRSMGARDSSRDQAKARVINALIQTLHAKGPRKSDEVLAVWTEGDRLMGGWADRAKMADLITRSPWDGDGMEEFDAAIASSGEYPAVFAIEVDGSTCIGSMEIDLSGGQQ